MTAQSRWKHHPEGANWGEYGADDQLGRLTEPFCLSLPLDYRGESVLAWIALAPPAVTCHVSARGRLGIVGPR
jgi:hypothetical protein